MQNAASAAKPTLVRTFPSRYKAGKAKQQGFSLVEVSIVTAIILLIAIIGIPAINGYITENRVPKVAEEVQRFIAGTKALAEGTSSAPYSNISTADNLVRALDGTSVLKVDAANGQVFHRIGNSTSGLITVASAQLDGTAGDAFTVTFADVSEKACPTLATILQPVAENISINGTAVKTYAAGVAAAYDPMAAQQQCTSGNTNNFVFTTR